MQNIQPSNDFDAGDIMEERRPVDEAVEHLAERGWGYMLTIAQRAGVALATEPPLEFTGHRDEFVALLTTMLAPIRVPK